MALIRCSRTNFIIADPQDQLFDENRPTDTELTTALSPMILSASGWRKVFAPGGEESLSPLPSPADRLLAVGMGWCFGRWLAECMTSAAPTVLVGLDTRPTGPALADAMIRGLVAAGCRLRYAFITAAPELMAAAGMDEEVDAFAYVSASHNPIGHNGVKFGVGNGVIGGEDAKTVISAYRALIGQKDAASFLTDTANSVDSATLISIYENVDTVKNLVLAYYRDFLTVLAGGPGDEASRRTMLDSLKSGLETRPLSVIADFNGSARSLSVDRDFLAMMGVSLETFNDKPREFSHAILPEGPSLEPCAKALEEKRLDGRDALIGYVPDCDGDRGNLVIWDNDLGAARVLEAQEVFSLSVLAELAALAWSDLLDGPTAVVVNGPTSQRIAEIASAYGVEVHEAEVGEANVVNRAKELRRGGYTVRILGEGSNGGTITHPAAVRDPLNTVVALLKLLRLPSTPEKPAPFEDWCRRIDQPESWKPDFGPADVIASLPRWTTTPASAQRAMTSISVEKHGDLKEAWETVFLMEWGRYADDLASAYGFHTFQAVNNEGTASRLGLGPGSRSGSQKGGLKIQFLDAQENPTGFLWMRGSGTEPVFRILVDLKGNDEEGERSLLAWHRAMVAEADRLASKRPALGAQELPHPVPKERRSKSTTI